MTTDGKFVRLTPNAGINPSVARVAAGTQRVYWLASQGVDVNEPPGYTAPNDWPVALTLLKRPRAFRVLTHEGKGGNPQTCASFVRTYHVPPIYVDFDLDTFSVGLCPCDLPGSYSNLGQIALQGHEPFTYAQMTDTGYLNSIIREGLYNYIGSTSDVASSDCTGPALTGSADVFRDAANAASLPTRVGRVVTQSLPEPYLAPVSVTVEDTPVDSTQTPFIGGDVLNILFFGHDLGNYDPNTVRASEVGQRLIAAYPVFKKYATVLIADTTGNLSASFKTQLSGVAAALADVGFSYQEYTSGADALIAGLLSSFFGS